ncbi:MAG: hypothetical protein ACE5D7_04485, partial [Fidelibacterota bacterium]
MHSFHECFLFDSIVPSDTFDTQFIHEYNITLPDRTGRHAQGDYGFLLGADLNLKTERKPKTFPQAKLGKRRKPDCTLSMSAFCSIASFQAILS